jgi:hypothetical protein
MFRSCPDQEGTSIQRRALLMGGFAGAIGYVFPAVANAAPAIVLPTAAANRRFSVQYKGFRIGSHTISCSSATGETRVNTEINLEVKVAFLTAYAFSHRSEETWRAGRLVSLNSDTVEHGEPLHVEGSATPQGFRGVSKGGPFVASAATLTSNGIWTPAMLEQATVVDAQRGGIIGISAHKVADEPITIAGSQVQATRYTFITPYYAGSVWYDKANLWVRGEFERDGSKVEYQLEI